MGDRSVSVLGVCFGAQLLAVALDGDVVTDGVLEVGLGPATLTDAGRADPVLGSPERKLTVLVLDRFVALQSHI